MRTVDEIAVELVPCATDDVRHLIAELDQILAAEYPPEQRHGLGLEAIFKPTIRFFLAWLNGAAVGSGGVALFPDLPK
jgi:putative acetyltransferase